MIKAEHKHEISKKTGKFYDYIQLSVSINGKEIKLKRVFLNHPEKMLLYLSD